MKGTAARRAKATRTAGPALPRRPCCWRRRSRDVTPTHPHRALPPAPLRLAHRPRVARWPGPPTGTSLAGRETSYRLGVAVTLPGGESARGGGHLLRRLPRRHRRGRRLRRRYRADLEYRAAGPAGGGEHRQARHPRDALRAAGSGPAGLPAADQSLAQEMMEDSDNSAATSLWNAVGGPATDPVVQYGGWPDRTRSPRPAWTARGSPGRDGA